MPSISNYLSTIGESRAVDAWARIQGKPTAIVVVRGKNTTLAAQTVRLEASSNPTEVKGEGDGSSARLDVVVFGVKGHPTVANTDLKRDDRFAVAGVQYKVVHVVEQTGEIQAQCEALV